MPRAAEVPHQRQHSRVPLRAKSSACSEANSLHRAASVERSSKLKERRSPGTVLQENKREAKVVDLEMKLNRTMEELKELKELLASSAAVKEPQNKLNKEKEDLGQEEEEEEEEKGKSLPVEKDCDSCITSEAHEIASSCSAENTDQLNPNVDTLEASRSDEKRGEEEEVESLEIARVRAKLSEKEKQLATAVAEKESLQTKAKEATERAEEAETKLAAAEADLRQSRAMADHLMLKLEAAEGAKESMKAEMKRLRIQTEQWRKASEAAASIIAGGDESVDFSGNGVGYSSFVIGEGGDEGQKRRASGGIRVIGDLWKRKGQQK